MKRLLMILLLMLSLISLVAFAQNASCPIVKIELERLPDLNVPRSGHTLFCAGGEMVVAGGHTSGFVPTPTSEYYRDGKWHLMQMTYTHDNGFALVLKSGKVLLGGGVESPHGIGRTNGVEYYHPGSHSFEGFTILDQKRSVASAIEIDSGKVVVSGNWYADDAIEIFDGQRHFTHLKPVSSGRSCPIMCHISADDIMLFSPNDQYGKKIDPILIDRLKGESFTDPLFDDWSPLSWEFSSNECGFIGNKEAGEYAYLLAMENKHDGGLGIAKVVGTDFSLLPTASPIPMEAGYGHIKYDTYLMADRQAQRGYVMGVDDDRRLYVLAIDYSQTPAPLTLYYTGPLESGQTPYMPALTPEGDLMLTGGISGDNFSPFSTVYLMHVGSNATLASQGMALGRWAWVLLVLLLLALLAAYWFFRRSRRNKIEEEDVIPLPASAIDDALINRIDELLESEKLFQDSELKVTDVADRLNINSRSISDTIKANHGFSFVQYVNGFRVEHAKQLLRLHPEKKIAEICMESGFASERSFYRIFKASTGMTAQEWIAKQN